MGNLEILYDHYKETNELRLGAENRRNRNFILLCVFEALAFLVIIRPELVFAGILDEINSKIEIPLNITSEIIQSLLWVMIVFVQIRYIQNSLYIEKQFSYQAMLEQEIRARGNIEISRESSNYLENYPIVMNIIDLFYKMLCPILFSAINIVHVIRELQVGTSTLPAVLDFILCLVSFVVMWFYFFAIHSKITAWFEKHIPPVKWMAVRLRKILKGV